MSQHLGRAVTFRRHALASAAASCLSLLALSAHAQAPATGEAVQQLEAVTVTAEEQLRQSLGVSVITESDLEKRPPANDLSEILRTQPGVTITGSRSVR